MSADDVGRRDHGVAQFRTEEWMIDRPDHDGFISLLPSFIESIWMQDTDGYISDGLRSFLEMMRDRGVRPLGHRLMQQQYPALERQALNTDAPPQPQSKVALYAAQLVQWKHAIELLSLRRAMAFLKLWERVLDRFRPELQCWLRYIVERYCVMHRRNSGTLVDLVFGMIRVKAARNKDATGKVALVPLENVDRIRLALVQAMIPYLWERFQDFYRDVVPPTASIRSDRTPRSLLQLIRNNLLQRRLWIQRLLPILVSIGYGANACCQFRYLLGLSHYTDLRNTLLRHIVRRATQEDLPAPATNAAHPLAASNAPSFERWKTILPTMGWILLASSLSLSWGTQMIHWYRERYRELQQEQLQRKQYHPEEPRTTQFPAHILPVPLLPPETAILQAVPQGCCLLCNEPLFSEEGKSSRYPTALNGYIYCYACIASHVRQHGMCPVTDQKVFDEAKQLIRLYTETAKT